MSEIPMPYYGFKHRYRFWCEKCGQYKSVVLNDSTTTLYCPRHSSEELHFIRVSDKDYT